MYKTTFKKVYLAIVFAVCAPVFVFAHQPQIVTSRETVVVEPEISKAYYATLAGTPDTYTIDALVPFNLYVNVLVPDIAGQKKDVSASITKDGNFFASLDSTGFAWKAMFEKFGHDNYFAGPEFKSVAPAGKYVVSVSSPSNDSKYSLAIGEIESFGFKETLRTLKVVPQLKKDFFNESPISFILSPLGWGLIVVLYILAALFGLLYRYILKAYNTNTVRGAAKNIGTGDRVLRFAIGILLLIWAITTSWSPALIFFSGFCIFEAMFSWCGFYAAIGKTTCPI